MKKSCMVLVAAVLAAGSLILPTTTESWAQGGVAAPAKEADSITLDLVNVDLRSALQALFTRAGKNYSIDTGVTGTIPALSMQDVPFESALKSIARANGLTFRVDDGVYVVSKKAEAPAAATDVVTVIDTGIEIDEMAVEEVVIDKVPLYHSSPSEILAAMNGDTSREYGGLNGNGWGNSGWNTGYGNSGGYGNYGGYGSNYGGYGIGNQGFGANYGYGGYGSSQGFNYNGRSYTYGGARR